MRQSQISVLPETGRSWKRLAGGVRSAWVALAAGTGVAALVASGAMMASAPPVRAQAIAEAPQFHWHSATAATSAPRRDACAAGYETRYLLAGTLPPVGTVCHQDKTPF